MNKIGILSTFSRIRFFEILSGNMFAFSNNAVDFNNHLIVYCLLQVTKVYIYKIDTSIISIGNLHIQYNTR